MTIPRGSTTSAVAGSQTDIVLLRFLGGMSVFTMLMTIPQVLTTMGVSKIRPPESPFWRGTRERGWQK